LRILSWNIQCGKSCDGVIDIFRTARHIETLGDFDLICLQEVARNMEEYCAPSQMDQLQILSQAFPEFHPVWGSGFSWPSLCIDRDVRREFGNLTLVKPMLLDSQTHPLPRPATPDKKQMQRTAIETVIDSRIGHLGIINTHLAFHDEMENFQQIERLHLLEAERLARQKAPGETVAGCYAQCIQPTARIACGDFNFATDSKHYKYQLEKGWNDAWRLANPDIPHPPTCGIFDREQWADGPHCRDFFWMSSELKNIKVEVDVDTTTDLSDHQPVVLELEI